MVIKCLLLIFLSISMCVMPVISGGYLEQQALFYHSYPIKDDAIAEALFMNKYIEAGSSPIALIDATCSSDFALKQTDFESDLETYNTYFTAIATKAIWDISDETYKSLKLRAYVILPNSFDSVQITDIHFADENPSTAEITISFTYNGKPYVFTKAKELVDGDNEINLFLQPFCDEFEGLDIETSKTFQDSVSVDGGDFEGSLSMEAKKI